MRINQKIHLQEIPLGKTFVPEVAKKHAIFIVDCSGSMWDPLPYLRENFKNKIVTSMNEGDKLTIVYYSSNGQCGFLLKNYQYTEDISSLNGAQKAIEMLRPMGCTGFVDPLDLVTDFTEKDLKGDSLAKVVIFMSDGYENENPKTKVIAATERLSKTIDSAVVVEYGNYANHSLLMEMSDTLGASFIYAKDFSNYNLEVNKIISSKLSANKIKVSIPNAQMVYSVDGNTITEYRSDTSEYLIPESAGKLYAVVQGESQDRGDYFSLATLLYQGVLRGDALLCWDTLAQLGDIALIDGYSNSIGKVKSLEYLEQVKAHIGDSTLWYSKGKDYSYIPPEDAFSVMDLLQLLSNGDNRLATDSKDFHYRRIGRKRVSKKDKLSDETLANLSNVKSKAEALALLINEPDVFEVNFVQDSILDNRFSNLAFNSKKANVSIRCQFGGFIKLPQNKFGIDTIQTYIYRQYAILKDGILNFDILPVYLDNSTFEVLKSKGLVSGDWGTGVYLLDLTNLPTTNRKSIKALSVVDFANTSLETLELQGKLKVYNNYVNDLYPKTSSKFLAMYGEEGEQWLKSLGITEFNGFNAPSETEESTDFYMSPTVEVKIKGETLPSVKDAIDKKDNSKVSLGTKFMAEAVKEVEAYLESEEYKNAADKTALFKIFLEGKKNAYLSQKRQLENKLAQMVLGKLLSRTEWSDATVLVDGKFTIGDVDFTVVEKEEQVKL